MLQPSPLSYSLLRSKDSTRWAEITRSSGNYSLTRSQNSNFCCGFLRELLVQIEQLVISQVSQVILCSTHSQIATFHVCESLFGWSTAAWSSSNADDWLSVSSVSSASIFTAWGCAEASCKACFIAAAEFGMSLRNYVSWNSNRRVRSSTSRARAGEIRCRGASYAPESHAAD